MKIETLKDRIKNSKDKITKITETLERHNKQLDKKVKTLINAGIDLNNYNKFQDNKKNYWELCEYENKLTDIKNNEKKLQEAKNSLAKFTEQLNNQLAKDEENNNLIPEVLNTFLENWKQKCFEFYTNLANEYIGLKIKDPNTFEITLEELHQLKTKKYCKNYSYEYVNLYNEEQISKILNNEITDYEKEKVKMNIKCRYLESFIKNHFNRDIYILEKIIDYDRIDNEELNEILDQEVKEKKENFIYRIKEVIGEIKDLNDLKIADNGEINGIAKGVKCNAKVETITAGGYNVQCYHFRILVNTVK